MQTNNKLCETALAIRADILKRRSENCWYATDSDILEKIDAALAAPPRQCDVGTVEEQMKRQHDTMCNTTKACPDSDWSCKKCFAEWTQTPYKEGGTK